MKYQDSQENSPLSGTYIYRRSALEREHTRLVQGPKVAFAHLEWRFAMAAHCRFAPQFVQSRELA
jgi:hypothetical protein